MNFAFVDTFGWFCESFSKRSPEETYSPYEYNTEIYGCKRIFNFQVERTKIDYRTMSAKGHKCRIYVKSIISEMISPLCGRIL